MENGAAAKNAPEHTLANCRRAHRNSAQFRSLGLLLEVCDLLRRKTRTQTRSFLVPLARFRRVGDDADGAEPPNHGRIEGLCESQCAIGAARRGCALQQEPRRNKIAIVQRILATFEQNCDFGRIKMQSRRLWLGRRRLRYSRGRRSGRRHGGGRLDFRSSNPFEAQSLAVSNAIPRQPQIDH